MTGENEERRERESEWERQQSEREWTTEIIGAAATKKNQQSKLSGAGTPKNDEETARRVDRSADDVTTTEGNTKKGQRTRRK